MQWPLNLEIDDAKESPRIDHSRAALIAGSMVHASPHCRYPERHAINSF
jgi:hypothetical protein